MNVRGPLKRGVRLESAGPYLGAWLLGPLMVFPSA